MAPFAEIGEETASPAWLVTFIDLVSLLLTFFVLLFAMSSLKGEPWRAARANLTTVFGGHEALPRPASLRNEGWRRDRAASDLDYLAGVLETRLAGPPALRDVGVAHAAEGLVLRLPIPLLFAPDAGTLSEDGAARLMALARLLAPVRGTITVEARDQGSGGGEDAWEESLARALVVARALRQAGVRAPVVARGRSDTQATLAPAASATGDPLAPAGRVDLIITEAAAAP